MHRRWSPVCVATGPPRSIGFASCGDEDAGDVTRLSSTRGMDDRSASGPSIPLAGLPPLIPSDTLRALSALVTARRNLVQLFTLCSFVLLVQLTRSLRLELRLYKVSEGADWATYWLRRGEVRRNGSVVGFAFLVTGGCLAVKVVTAFVGRGVWSGESER